MKRFVTSLSVGHSTGSATSTDPVAVTAHEAFFVSAFHGDIEKLLTFIASGTPVDSIWHPYLADTALHYGAQSGSEHCVAELLRLGAMPNVQYLQGDTPLHIACRNGDTKVVKVLLERSNVTLRNNKHLTACEVSKLVATKELFQASTHSCLEVALCDTGTETPADSNLPSSLKNLEMQLSVEKQERDLFCRVALLTTFHFRYFETVRFVSTGNNAVITETIHRYENEILIAGHLPMHPSVVHPISSFIGTVPDAWRNDIPHVPHSCEGFMNMPAFHIVMPHAGVPLKSFLTKSGAPVLDVDSQKIKTLLKQLLSAIVHLEDNLIVHKALKNEHILVSEDQGVCNLKLIDFGLARICLNSDLDCAVPVDDVPWGTPMTLPPDVAAGIEATIPLGGIVRFSKADSFAAGLVIWDILSPLPGDFPTGKLFNPSHLPPITIGSVKNDTTFADVLLSLMNPFPCDRMSAKQALLQLRFP
ncbi:hypothetical protein Pelo_11477 [Pelomyxa schiedti]|nr:hypothetical protein Pelo_11477 [Pelomyxa schiedti]